MSDGDIRLLEAYRKTRTSSSKAFGNLFENMFQTMCKRVGIAVTRFPDGCRRAGRGLVPVPTPCDWIVTYQGRSGMIDTKTCDDKSFIHSKIRAHQVNEMAHHELQGAKAGYVIWLRKSDIVLFVSALRLQDLAKHPGSIQQGQNQVEMIGTSSFFDMRLILSDPGIPLDAG